MKNKKGVIYIFTNPSFPEYVKIGYADDVNERLKTLNASSVIPFAFRAYATYEVDHKLEDKKDLGEDANDGLTLYQFEHRLEKRIYNK